MNLVFVSWLIFLLPLSIVLFDGGPTQSIYYQIGIACQVIALVLYSLAGEVTRLRAGTLLALIGLTLMYMSNALLNVNSLAYLAFLPLLSLAIPTRVSHSSARLMVVVFFALVVLQGLFVGYYAYPNSDKDVLLLWNPNVFWHHATMFLVLLIYTGRRMPVAWLAAYALGCTAFGFSRGAALLLALALCLRLMSARRKLVSAVSGLVIAALVAILAALLVAPAEIYANLAEFDDLLSGRVALAFEAPVIAGSDVSTVSDTPVIDVMLWGHPVLFVIGFVAALVALRRQLEVLILFLVGFLMDSTIYAPIIAFIYFQLFRLGSERNGTAAEAPHGSEVAGSPFPAVQQVRIRRGRTERQVPVVPARNLRRY